MNTQDWNPGTLLELSGYFWKTCTLHAGIKLDLFTIIGDRQLTGKEIAAALGGDERGMTMLLNALTAMNILFKKENKFSNTAAAKTFLSTPVPLHLRLELHSAIWEIQTDPVLIFLIKSHSAKELRQNP